MQGPFGRRDLASPCSRTNHNLNNIQQLLIEPDQAAGVQSSSFGLHLKEAQGFK